MASRLARTAAGACRIRPTLSLSARGPPLPSLALGLRASSSDGSPAPSAAAASASTALEREDPKSKAQSILDALPGSSLISKTAILSSAAGLSIFAISNEYYVVNEESVAAFCLICVWTALIKYGGPMYAEWADAQADRLRGILNAARADHKQAVKDRIDSVQQMSEVVDVTQTLFEVSKETAKLEAQVYELEQKTALAAEAKTVLDSWVRYESQLKQRQQKELADAIIAKVRKELENPKILQQILQQSIADVEKIVVSKAQ